MHGKSLRIKSFTLIELLAVVMVILLLAAILIGLVDTFGKVLTLQIGGLHVLPELSGMMIYVLMAVVLLARPEGLFGRRG